MGIEITLNGSETTTTDAEGNWSFADLTGTNTIAPSDPAYSFTPVEITVREIALDNIFVARPEQTDQELQVLRWLENQQLPNGLLESTENGNVVSLYDQALSALVFLANGDFERAERIFDFFEARIDSELRAGVGGFSQFRDRNGNPNNHRWMGDNAWLLIALNNYRHMTGNTTYDGLSEAIKDWLIGLQDTDGGLFAGYGSDNTLLPFKGTEGNIDAFNAVWGYDAFHSDLLNFLENDRWDVTEQSLVAWPGNPAYLYALDCHSWSYCIFEDFPFATLTSADRFLTTQTATLTGEPITGYDIDEDREVVFVEGTGQMALAFKLAGQTARAEDLLTEMEKVLIESPVHAGTFGFPYASNPGSFYGSDPYWSGADTHIAISSGAWYLFARWDFNPFAVEREKDVPVADRFW